MVDRENTILLVENEPLIAMDLEEMLHSAGYARVAHVLSCEAAMDWLDLSKARLAILDLIVHDGSTTQVAERLLREKTPFVVYSGLSRQDAPPEEVFEQALWLAKPCTQPELLTAIDQVLGSAAG